MEQKVNLNKDSFAINQYERVIDTSFSQLIEPDSVIAIEQLPTVDEFFENYNTLFFQIPKTGENSHEELIVKSTDYIGFKPLNDEIQALQEEITSLKTQLLEANQRLADLAQDDIPN
tara:strand:- start:1403 stop:1753 length:351 start_codon:yes stop_codon:yes gene_type:complete